MCDPEEQAATCYGAVARDSSQTEDANETGDTGFDPASGVMLLALFFLVAARLRAY
jgi:hypothetical protein